MDTINVLNYDINLVLDTPLENKINYAPNNISTYSSPPITDLVPSINNN